MENIVKRAASNLPFFFISERYFFIIFLFYFYHLPDIFIIIFEEKKGGELDMMEGFSRDTEFYVMEPDLDGNLVETLHSFYDFKDGDIVSIKTRKGDIIQGTIKEQPVDRVLYTHTFSTERYQEVSTGKLYDIHGKQWLEDGIEIGRLTNESTREHRIYYGAGYAKMEQSEEAIHENDSYKPKRAGTIAYTFYDTNDQVIEKGLTQEEIENLVYQLTHIDYDNITRGLENGDFIKVGFDYDVRCTFTHTWWLYDGNKEKCLRENDRLYNHPSFNESDPLLSGSMWHLKETSIQGFCVERPWTITSKRYHSFILKYNIPTGE